KNTVSSGLHFLAPPALHVAAKPSARIHRTFSSPSGRQIGCSAAIAVSNSGSPNGITGAEVEKVLRSRLAGEVSNLVALKRFQSLPGARRIYPPASSPQRQIPGSPEGMRWEKVFTRFPRASVT